MSSSLYRCNTCLLLFGPDDIRLDTKVCDMGGDIWPIYQCTGCYLMDDQNPLETDYETPGEWSPPTMPDPGQPCPQCGHATLNAGSVPDGERGHVYCPNCDQKGGEEYADKTISDTAHPV